eukprot:6253884-Pyramimonas_sp.AAC.1
MSERDMLHIVLMVNADWQIAMRADENTFENMPLSSQYPSICAMSTRRPGSQRNAPPQMKKHEGT